MPGIQPWPKASLGAVGPWSRAWPDPRNLYMNSYMVLYRVLYRVPYRLLYMKPYRVLHMNLYMKPKMPIYRLK